MSVSVPKALARKFWKSLGVTFYFAFVSVPLRLVFALIVALIRCYRSAHRSNKAIGASVALMIGALIPPLIGNLIIISGVLIYTL